MPISISFGCTWRHVRVKGDLADIELLIKLDRLRFDAQVVDRVAGRGLD
jgi:hypothetical protein